MQALIIIAVTKHVTLAPQVSFRGRDRIFPGENSETLF